MKLWRAVLIGLATCLLAAPATAEKPTDKPAVAKTNQASKARTPKGIWVDTVHINARPERPIAAIDVSKRKVVLPTATRHNSFTKRIGRTIHRRPF